MDVAPLRLMRLLLPSVPLFLKTFILSKLSMSTNSDKQDTRTELITLLIRRLMGATDKSLKAIQDGSIKDLTVKGRMWISKVEVPSPLETDIRDLVLRAIDELGDGTEEFSLPDIANITAEWTGFRDCDKKAVRLQISEQEQYEHMMKEVKSDATVLYFHGGAYILMDPATHRIPTSHLARKTGGRCFSVRYRLAPQDAFPSQLIDAFLAYLYLVAPPADAYHDPVSPDKIVLAGDSAGGNLAFSLLLLLTTLRNMGVNTVKFNEKEVNIGMPAGIIGISPWTDIARSLPTIYNNARFDYLDPPSATGMPHKLPPDELWPSNPPRAEMFCTASLLSHPLVSPLLATPAMWKGASPAFVSCGNEGLEDEITVTTRRLYQAGASVYFTGYEGMPHCFSMIFPDSTAGKDCFEKMVQFVTDATEGRTRRTDAGQWLEAFSSPPRFRPVDLATMGVSDDEVSSRVQSVKSTAMQREQESVRQWEQHAKARL